MIELALESEYLRRLESLKVLPPKSFPTAQGGIRLSSARGSGLEFADYRSYTPGDDFRHIDWNLFARLNQLNLKTFSAEESIHVYVFLDCSASMRFGQPAKIVHAVRIAASLGYLTLANNEQLTVLPFRRSLEGEFCNRQERRCSADLMQFLGRLSASGEGSLDQSSREFIQRAFPPGIVFVLSDFLPTSDISHALGALTFEGFALIGLRIFDPSEEDPEAWISSGPETLLVDCETGERLRLASSDEATRLYRVELDQWLESLARTFDANRGCFLSISTSDSLEDVMFSKLRQNRILG